MIDLRNLIDLLPSYYKENDSYKVDGQGLLERFLNICGDYFADYPVSDLDGFLENLDVKKTDITYINNFWKFFGELPFAIGPIIDPEQFTNTFNGFNLDEALKVSTQSSSSLPYDIDYRSILRYAISLFKIRGTKQFFEVYFRLLNMTCSITEDSEDLFKGVEDYGTPFDDEYSLFDKTTCFDHTYNCKQCAEVKFNVSSKSLPSDQASFYCQVYALIERFVPFYVHPNLTISGIDDSKFKSVTIEVNPKEYILPLGGTIELEVTVKPDYPQMKVDLGWYLEFTDANGKTTRTTKPCYDRTFIASAPGTYKFISVEDESKTDTAILKEQYQTVSYRIFLAIPSEEVINKDPNALILSFEQKKINLQVKAQKITITYENGKVVSNSGWQDVSVLWLDKKDKDGNYLSGIPMNVTATTYGDYHFCIEEYQTKTLTVTLGVTEDYKKFINQLTLEVTPRFLLVVGNSTQKGAAGGLIGDLNEGIYSSSAAGKTWSPADFWFEFKVTNALGEEVDDANISWEDDPDYKIYHPGDKFIPPVYTAKTYNFIARDTNNNFSNTDVGVVRTQQAPTSLNIIWLYLEAIPEELTFVKGKDQTQEISGTIAIQGVSQSDIEKIKQITVKRLWNDSQQTTVTATYSRYQGNIAYYTFSDSISTPSSDGTITYRPVDPMKNTDVTSCTDTVLVRVVNVRVDEPYLYPDTTQSGWEGTGGNGSGYDELTFKATEDNTLPKFQIKCAGNVESITCEGKTYKLSTDIVFDINEIFEDYFRDTNFGPMITSFKQFNFKCTNPDKTLTVNLHDYDTVVTINASPSTGTLFNNTEAITNVSGSSNKKRGQFRDAFLFKDESGRYSIPYGESLAFAKRAPTIYTFTAIQDPFPVATFAVDSQIKYKVTFLIDDVLFYEQELLPGEVIDVKTPSKEGYTFSGWSGLPAGNIMPDHDVIVIGSWNSIPGYNLTYMVDGEFFAKDTYKGGETITPRAKPTKSGYTFNGWNGMPSDLKMPERDLTVTGTFTKNAPQIYSYWTTSNGLGIYGTSQEIQMQTGETTVNLYAYFIDQNDSSNTTNPFTHEFTTGGGNANMSTHSLNIIKLTLSNLNFKDGKVQGVLINTGHTLQYTILEPISNLPTINYDFYYNAYQQSNGKWTYQCTKITADKEISQNSWVNTVTVVIGGKTVPANILLLSAQTVYTNTTDNKVTDVSTGPNAIPAVTATASPLKDSHANYTYTFHFTEVLAPSSGPSPEEPGI